jgi:hypothetical protein
MESTIGPNPQSTPGSSARHRKSIGRPYIVGEDAPARPTSQSAETRSHRSLLSGRRAEQVLREAPEMRDDRWDDQEWATRDWDERDWDERGGDEAAQGELRDRFSDDADADDDATLVPAFRRDSSGRLRASSAARPLPSVPRRDRKMVAHALSGQLDDTASGRTPRGMTALDARVPRTALALPTASVPDLVAYRPPRARPRVDTRAIVETARKPWSLARISLAFLAAVFAIITTYAAAGERAQPLMFSQASAVAGAGPVDVPWPVNAVTAKVQPETQLKRVDQYDSVDQMNLWGPADCSAAVISEILTAYGTPNATIGRMVNELGPDISPHGGLLTYDGFNKVAQLHGMRADLYVDKQLTYDQMRYLTNTLGIPVIVNVRISYGYYHFFSGGHFLVMTYGDDQGLRLVDSSEYYLKYLPIDVFKSMFTGRTAVIVPKDFQYTLPT